LEVGTRDLVLLIWHQALKNIWLNKEIPCRSLCLSKFQTESHKAALYQHFIISIGIRILNHDSPTCKNT
jgi:hypothetical protein